MFTIVRREQLNQAVVRMDIQAPLIAAKAQPGQFVILRAHEQGERIPLTIAEADGKGGTVAVIFQVVGATTRLLAAKKAGEAIPDVAGPLGLPTHTEGLSKVAVVGGGVGCAIAYPIAKKLHEQGTTVHTIAGFRTAELVILQREFEAVSDRFLLVSDDGSTGMKGRVTDCLSQLLEQGEQYDQVLAIGPLIMMKFVSDLTRPYGIKTVVSMNPIMIDGTGMCGGCRLTVGGKTRFACVDGPEFDGHEVDFDEAMSRLSFYKQSEQQADAHVCRLLEGGEAHA